jgi:hypothetical protein
MTDFHWSVTISRQLDIYAEMRLTPSVIVRGRECNKLVGHYRETAGGRVEFDVSLWERYDEPDLPPGTVLWDSRRPVTPVTSTEWDDRPHPAEIWPFIDALTAQMRLNGVPANATLTPPRPPSTPKDDRRE